MLKDEFHTTAIDLDRFAKTPCSDFILSLLFLINDIDALVELNKSRKET
jgi:hypothetical protein